MTDTDMDGIAIIGLTGRFPGAANADQFWRNLAAGVESISTFTDEELAASGFDATMLRKEPGFVPARGIVEKAEWFDAGFFGMNPKEAEVTDPQQRLFLEASWEAIENSGYHPQNFPGLIGVYAGMGNNTYYLNNLHSRPDLVGLVGHMAVMMANEKDFLATKVAYKLNLKGPAINVNTACSTSLVAVCMACQSLQSFQCDIALAGGVSVSFPQKRGLYFQEGGIVAPDGHCRAFDAQAQGTVSSDGLGIVVLKRLAEAMKDGDEIFAVIKGVGLNNDGSGKVSFTSPSVNGQAEAIALAQAQAGFDPTTISYIEAHGTGTPLGDPIEIEGLTQAFGAVGKKNFCALGSVKSNIGHLDTAAGVAGLIKTVLALKNKKLPPSLYFAQPNQRIDFANSPFFVNTALTEWPAVSTPRRAGVSSFGLGGTNAHVVLEEAPAPKPSGLARDWQLLVWSARTSSALDTATANLLAHLKANPDINLADVAYTLQLGRAAFNHRRILVCRDVPDAIKALETLDPKRVLTQHHETGIAPVAFMFPGQGAQYVGMGAELYRTEPVFREEVDRGAEILRPLLGLDLREVLFPKPEQAKSAEELLIQTRITQPALFVIEYALAKLWMSWGVKPRAMIGHSVGEYVAGCLAGIFTYQEALELVAHRARLVQMQPGGAMLAVRLPEKEVRSLLQDGLSLAAVNSSTLCVISGSYESIDRLTQQLAGRGVAGIRLQTSHAFHSAMMDPVIPPFTELLQKTKFREPTIPYVSNVTAQWVTAADATNPNYWAAHVRQTVRFADGVGELLKDPQNILLEAGPGQTLGALARQHPARGHAQLVVSSLASKDSPLETCSMLNALGKLWLAGAEVDWAAFHQHHQRRRVPLPTYPFERKRFWAEPGFSPDARQRVPTNGSLIASIPPLPPSGERAGVRGQEMTEIDMSSPTVGTDALPRVRSETPATIEISSIPLSRKDRIRETLTVQLQELSGKTANEIPVTLTFMELGFDSLFLAQASQAFHKKLGVHVTFRQMLGDLSTVNDLAEYFDSQLPPETPAQINDTPSEGPQKSMHVQDENSQRQTAVPQNSSTTLPLSEAQTELWLATRWGEDASRAFNQVVCLRLRGTLKLDPLRDALNELMARHDTLRATFPTDGGSQRIARFAKLELSVTDISTVNPTDREAELASIIHAEDAVAFDLVNGPVLRAKVVKLDEQDHVLLLATHHLIMDGWSIGVAFHELGALYTNRLSGTGGPLPPALQFQDYLQWQNSPQTRAASGAAQSYWLKQFANPPAPMELPGDHPRPAAPSYRAYCQGQPLKLQLHQALKTATARQRVTIFTYLFASINVWLHRLGGQEDLAIGIPAAGQAAVESKENAPDGNSLIGHCVNLLPVRSRCEGNMPFNEYLKSLQQLMFDAHEHQNFTYGNLVQQLNLPRDSSRAPLLSATFNVFRAPRDIHFEGLQTELWFAPKGFNFFDLSVDIKESEAGLRLDCRFNRDLFEPATMQRWLSHWPTLLEAMVKQPECPIAKLPMLDSAARQQILVGWNKTEAAYPQSDTVPQLFEAQVRQNPQAIALTFENRQLTYQELNTRANRLAHHLKQQGVGPETLVALCLERSPEMLIGLLAILKAGGAYVPLDPHYPAERLSFILQDAQVKLLLTQQSLLAQLNHLGASASGPARIVEPNIICLDPELSVIGPQSEANLTQSAKQDNLAYVLYTSGSTGKPKGVQIPHRALTNFLTSMAREPGLTASDILLAVTTLSFDIAGLELWLPLTVGAQVVLASTDTARDAKALSNLLQQSGATVMQATPATWRMLLESGWTGNPQLKILCGGEAWGSDLAQALLPKCSSLWNMYGPTETTIWSAATQVQPGETPSVGKPIANTQFYVLDAQLQPVPIGVAGELHIGGDGLARGYLNRSELTAEKFIPDPFRNQSGARMYKTGDLVRYRGEGRLEFLGRLDHQVKIRGFRIELGEIESVLLRHPNIKEAVVSARGATDGEKRLVAYVVSRQQPPPTNTELKTLVFSQLPEYMTPSAFMVLDALPLTPNGKVDRKALPEPEIEAAVEDFVPPSTPAELAVAKLWCEVLGVKRVGLQDNFFSLGGHSLMATQLISRFEKFHKVTVKLRDIFESPTLGEMSQMFERKQAASVARPAPLAAV